MLKGESTIWSITLWVRGNAEVKNKDATAPIDLPQRMNLLYPYSSNRSNMISSCNSVYICLEIPWDHSYIFILLTSHSHWNQSKRTTLNQADAQAMDYFKEYLKIIHACKLSKHRFVYFCVESIVRRYASRRDWECVYVWWFYLCS